MNDPDFEFNMDFALMDQQIEKFKEEDSRLLKEWHQDRELLHAQIEELKLRREETIMQCELYKQERDRLRQLLVADSERVDAYLGVCTERDEAIARRMETIMQCELLKQDVAKAAELLKHIEEQSRNNMTIVVGAPLREVICNCLNSICEKIDPAS
jgi:hypothetical protein